MAEINTGIAAFEQWVARNAHPHAPDTVRDVARKIAVVSSSVLATLPHIESLVATANGQPVVSNGKLVGPNAQQVLNADQAVARARASGQPQQLQASLAASPATGCAMAMSLAQRASGFNPSSPAAAGNLNGFLAYVGQLLQCPLFSAQLKDEVTPNMSGDWNSVINQIVGYYVGIAAQDLQDIRAGLWSLAQAASSTPSTNETQNLFTQNTLNAGADLQVYLYQSFIDMRTDVQHGGKHSPDTVTNNASLQLWRTILRFDSQHWPAYAPVIMSQTDATLQSWLNDTTTPQGPVKVNWNI
ncbi:MULTISPECIES: hypothetical protein [Burkholderiaceae]|uniref:hypothetical protein n=1 Tax=Burkholderiaceae TaxID=119060 RepID=UPI0014204546|nr:MULTISPECIES: hypothetical protein [Burkholderiaceae]MBN3845584.1 hypothetical protein [Paraburkholderia sp. Ac-20342]NIF51024.1 hypothetical protein [Burkholderia sp. Ax-1724]NIF75859.1 hypothetical protein [Paraburkholderia sp. Cy-641]